MSLKPDERRREPPRMRFGMRIRVLLVSIAFISPANGGGTRCVLSSPQVQETYFAVRKQAWTQCDCTLLAENASAFRRCYRQTVRRLGADQGLSEGCTRELTTGSGGPFDLRTAGGCGLLHNQAGPWKLCRVLCGEGICKTVHRAAVR